MKQKAFTLVELMVVIAIIAVLAVGSVTSYTSYIDKARITKGIAFERSLLQGIEASMYNKGRLPTLEWLFEEGSGFPQDTSNNDAHIRTSSTGFTFSSSEKPYGGSKYSISLDGTSRPISVNRESTSNISNWPTENITIAQWMKPDDITYQYGNTMAISTIENRFELRIVNTNTTSLFQKTHGVSIRSCNATCVNIESSEPVITTGKWHYIVGSYDGTTARLWVDGEKVAEGDFTQTILFDKSYNGGVNWTNFKIGDEHNPIRYIGEMDNVRVYPIAYLGE